MNKEYEGLDAWSSTKTEFMSFVNYVYRYGRQPVETNSFNQIMEMQALL